MHFTSKEQDSKCDIIGYDRLKFNHSPSYATVHLFGVVRCCSVFWPPRCNKRQFGSVQPAAFFLWIHGLSPTHDDVTFVPLWQVNYRQYISGLLPPLLWLPFLHWCYWVLKPCVTVAHLRSSSR